MSVMADKKINDLDRAIALARALYGDRPAKHGFTPQWMTLTITAEYLFDMGASAEAVISAFLHRVLLDSEITFTEWNAFCDSLHCDGAVVNKVTQLATIIDISETPFKSVSRFLSQKNPIELAHVFVAQLHTYYSRYERHNIFIESTKLDEIEQGLLLLLEQSDDALLVELISRLGERLEYLRLRPHALMKKEPQRV